MSSWTYITGTVVVYPLGRTQAEKRYILDTVLDHLPQVTGSEDNMHIHVIQKAGYDQSCSRDEFGERSNKLNSYGGQLELQSEYILVVEGALRDRRFDQTFKEFQKWICRLAKRIDVFDILVSIRDYDRSYLLTNTPISRNHTTVYGQMFESPTWNRVDKSGEPNWCEYLMWQNADNSDYPAVLAYKYFRNDYNDSKVESWLNLNSKQRRK